MRPIVVLMLVAMLAGCANRIEPISRAQIDQVREGQTTRQELVELFGRPLTRSVMSDGTEALGWAHGQATFSGYQSRSFTAIIGRDGKVASFTSSEVGSPP